MALDLWSIIHTERKALAADLEGLPEAAWSTPSLCAGWTVQHVLGHLTAAAKMTPPRFFAHLAGAGFRFHRMTVKDAARESAGTPAETLARFTAQSGARTHPPGPLMAMVGEAVVHGEDIRRPLGISHVYDPGALVAVADFYRSSNLIIGGKKRVEGLQLRATDASWSTGDGPQVSGPLLSLVLAIAGRPAALADLSGDGLPALTART